MLEMRDFEEASELVKKVTLETKLLYSGYFSAQTGNRVYFLFSASVDPGQCGHRSRTAVSV